MPAPIVLDLHQARAAWVRNQGLAAPVAERPAAVVGATGWIRTLGGADAYVSLLARRPGLTAPQVHEAVGTGALRVTPSVRGCIYLAPAEHAPLALSIARDLTTRRDARDAEKAGVEEGELDRVGEAVLAVLSEGPQTTAGLRKVLPEGAIRSLGAAGKKVGLSSTLPPALRVLEFAGRIRRQPQDDRLDSERYHWVFSPEDERTIDERPAAERHVDLARLFLRWFAPATVSELADFTGLTKTAARKAAAALDTVEVQIPGFADDALALAEQADDLAEPAPEGVRFLPGLDNLLIWRAGPKHFVHPDDHDRKIAVWGRQRGDTWGTVKHAMTRVVVHGDLVAGQWERDPDTGEIVVGAYSQGLPDSLQPARSELQALLDDLGHAWVFSIDNEEKLRARLDQVRSL